MLFRSGSLSLSFTCNFLAYFKFYSDLGRVIGKIKRNELEHHDTAPFKPCEVKSPLVWMICELLLLLLLLLFHLICFQMSLAHHIGIFIILVLYFVAKLL